MGISRSLRRRIKETILIDDAKVETIDSDSVWTISSTRHQERSYFVVRTAIECCFNEPGPCIAFTLSKACRHTFSCSCHDHINGNTCKHVLKISAFLGLWDPKLASLNTNRNTDDVPMDENVARPDSIAELSTSADEVMAPSNDQSNEVQYTEKLQTLRNALQVRTVLCSLLSM